MNLHQLLDNFARRPILSIGYTDGGVVKELLEQTQAGVHCSTEAELKEYLLKPTIRSKNM